MDVALRDPFALKDRKIAEVLSYAKAVTPREECADLLRFLDVFYAHAAADDIEDESVEDLYAIARFMWKLGRERRPGRPIVKVFNPREEKDGWATPHTAIAIVNDDMPFLVDSITGGLVAIDHHQIYAVHHPILLVARDEEDRVMDGINLMVIDRHQSARDRIDEEGHVVIDDGDGGVRRGPAVLFLAGVEDLHDRPARPALAPQLPHEAGDGVEILDRLVLDVVGRGMGVEDIEKAQQIGAFLARRDSLRIAEDLGDLAVLEGEGIAQGHIHGGRILPRAGRKSRKGVRPRVP